LLQRAPTDSLRKCTCPRTVSQYWEETSSLDCTMHCRIVSNVIVCLLCSSIIVRFSPRWAVLRTASLTSVSDVWHDSRTKPTKRSANNPMWRGCASNGDWGWK
jgi:hypothetical protein